MTNTIEPLTRANGQPLRYGVRQLDDGMSEFVCLVCGYADANRNRVNGHVSAGHRQSRVELDNQFTQHIEPFTRADAESITGIVALLDELRGELLRLRAFESAVLAAVNGSANGQ